MIQKEMNFEPSELLPEYSEDQKMAAERQITDLQRVVDYMIREYSIEELVEKYQVGRDRNKNKIVIPKEHRKFIWDEKKQSLFIESVLLGLPIAHLFVAEIPKTEHRFEIVDGSQRLRTLESFMDNKLILNGLQKLTLLNGFRFKDLPLSRQRRFKVRPIRLIELTHKADYRVKEDLFARMNQSNPFLKDVEQEQPAFSKFLEDCAKNSKFIQLCPMNTAQKAIVIPEMLIHFFAFSEHLYPEKEDTKDLHNKYLNLKMNRFDIAKMEEDFENMLDFVDAHFPYGFKKSENHNSTSRFRFETLAMGVHSALKTKPNLIPAQPIEDWISSKAFETHINNAPNKLYESIEFVKNKLLTKK